MCGIAGWFAWGKARPTADIVRGLLLAQQTRGSDAAGFAYVDPKQNKVIVRKQQGPAAKLIDEVPVEIWRKVAESPIGLLHARASTKGHERDNENNHPVVGYNWLAVHNGQVRNDDDLWDHYGEKDKALKRFAEVDTSAIPLVLSRGSTYLDSLEHLGVLAGSVTTAVLSLVDPTRLAIARLGSNDLYLVADTDNKILYYTSAGVAVRVLPSLSLHTLRFLNMTKMPDDRVMILEPGDAFQATVYKVDRHPFFGVRAPTKQAAKQPPTKSASTPLTDTKPAKSAGTPAGTPGVSVSVKWERNDPTEDKFKPSPLAFSHKNFSWLTFDPSNVSLRTSKLGDYTTLVIQTPYGRWMYLKGKTGVKTKFKPIKSVKKWMKKYYGDYTLPFKFLGDPTPLDDKLTLEILLVRTHLESGGGTPFEKQGRVCPWCGIHMIMGDWVAAAFRCPHCHVKSKKI